MFHICKVGTTRFRPSICEARRFSNISYTREVKEALSNGEPVVALESTIITHGMPYPANIEMARKVETLVRSEGAVPATIAILDGNIHVGLSHEELTNLAQCKDVIKVSRAEFPYAVGKKLTGGTTVAGTMIVADKAGIKVFVTGGIGGVHRGAEVSMDISADLTELGRTPVMVVSAGVKSILDIGLTLEYLETMGVCVTTFGPQGSNFPAFYTPDSGFRSPLHVASALEAASVMKANMDLNLKSGMLVGVPIPEREAALGIQKAIDTALEECEKKNIKGKLITPYLLSRLNDLTQGESLRANIALVENNARVGAQIACSLAQLNSGYTTQPSAPTRTSALNSKKNGIVVIGGSNFDFVVKIDEKNIEMNGATHYGKLQYSHGGVGRSLADALARLGNNTRLISAVGDDKPGQNIIRESPHIDTSLVIKLEDQSTATYTAILDRSGECIFGVGDMDIHSQISRDYLVSIEDKIREASLMVLDGNIPEDTIDYALKLCSENNIPVLYEPTCLRKAVKPLTSKYLGKVVTYVSPNLNELISMANYLQDLKIKEDLSAMKDLKYLSDISVRLMETFGFDLILLTLGIDGVLLTRKGLPTEPLPFKTKETFDIDRVHSVHYATTPVKNVVSVSGAGDCLISAFMTGLLQGYAQEQCISIGIQAARSSCKIGPAIPDNLSTQYLDTELPVQAVTIR